VTLTLIAAKARVTAVANGHESGGWSEAVAASAAAGAAVTVNASGMLPHLFDTTPLRSVPGYSGGAGALVTATTPPSCAEITPA
jgi:hypothetical protein